MKKLSRAILEDYEVTLNAPSRVNAVQFGDDPILLGLIDRLIDDANAKGLNLGLAVVQNGANGHAKQLSEQDGLYTAFVRGDLNEKEVRREQVVQCILEALDPEADDARLMTLAAEEALQLAILHEDEAGEFAADDRVARALLARFLVERWKKGVKPMYVLLISEHTDGGERLKRNVLEEAKAWGCGEAFEVWLDGCRFVSAFADSLTVRSDPDEALRLCREMNYKDTMIHLCEAYGLWAICADGDFREAFGLDAAEGVVFTDDLAPYIEKKQRVFDAGLFLLTALGKLHGNATLAECLKDEPLRDMIGHALMDEILPYLPYAREKIAPYIIASYERYANPLNENRLENAGRGLLRKCIRGVLPAMRAYADEHYAAPKNLTAALAAAVLLYADVRLRAHGYETVAGGETWIVHEDPLLIEPFTSLASDMDPESLAYAVLSDREIWGEDLREIDGLTDALVSEMAR